jgi:hypothetical protein
LFGGASSRATSEVEMAEKAEAVYLDDLGNVVPRPQARRVRITLVDEQGRPIREIWGTVYHPNDRARWPDPDLEYDLWG